MKFFGRIKTFYVGLDIKDMLFALLVLLAVICVQLAKINNSTLDVAYGASRIGSEISYK